MPKVKITISIDDSIIKLVKVKHRNTSKYIEELVKRDLFRDQEMSIYDTVVKGLMRDGYISGHTPYSSLDEPVIVNDY